MTESVRDVLGKMLDHLGYEAEFARDGSEAITLYSEAKNSGRSFAAVILDLTIPGGMGGKEALQKLLALDPRVRALASSGYSDDLAMADFQKYGFRSVLPKPYKISELSRALGEVVRESA
jgi:CheY-like chemotaxis protein